jgi:hypothetical protein
VLQRLTSVLLVAVLLGLALRGSQSLHRQTAWGDLSRVSDNRAEKLTEPTIGNDQPRRYFMVSGTLRTNRKTQDTKTNTAPVQRLREGREIRDPQATFQSIGDRMNCVLPSLGTTVTVLENLTLERVYELMTRHEESSTWEVEGVITEHQGRNYMLLRRAVVNSISLEEQ